MTPKELILIVFIFNFIKINSVLANQTERMDEHSLFELLTNSSRYNKWVRPQVRNSGNLV